MMLEKKAAAAPAGRAAAPRAGVIRPFSMERWVDIN
jgi:hypothetical protein